MTDTITAITITNDGIVVRETDEDPPGAYIGVDPADWLQGYPNVFVGTSLDDARQLAVGYIEEIHEAVSEALDTIGNL